MKIYISGKITGLEDVAVRHKFNSVELELRILGHNVVNPLRITPAFGRFNWSCHMLADLKDLVSCKAIYMLHDWKESTGARIEYRLARAIGMKVFHSMEELQKQSTVAERLTNLPHPSYPRANCFTKIAEQ